VSVCDAVPKLAVAAMVWGPPVSGFTQKVAVDAPAGIVANDVVVLQVESE
jgi:hypothetical protein